VLFGYGQKSWSLNGPGNPAWFTPDIPHYDYNPAEAKRLLATLGWADRNGDGVLEDEHGNAVSFTLKTNSNSATRVALANFVRDDLAKIGVKVTLVPMDFNTIVTNENKDFQYDAILLGRTGGFDPGMTSFIWKSNGASHIWHVRQPSPATPEEARIDQLMNVLMADSNVAARKAAWKEMQTIANEQCWLIWLPTATLELPVRNRFGNIEPSIFNHRLLWNIDRVYVKNSSRTPS
jgi:peptide/nickel transport system substrate-binding protein